jgi:hypothetical protein
MTYMRSWKSHRLTSHTWLGLNPQIGRPFSRIVGAIGLFISIFSQQKKNTSPNSFQLSNHFVDYDTNKKGIFYTFSVLHHLPFPFCREI